MEAAEVDIHQESEGSEGNEPLTMSDPKEHTEVLTSGERQSKKKVLTADRVRRANEERDRRGVVYVSRIPPHMKPMKLKQLLSQFGEVMRVYCAPEDHRLRQLRKKRGGNTGKNFTEGWVEFADKRIAKRVATMLNGERIGGKLRSAYYEDLWNLKYLRHFKWDDLTAEIAYQKAVREQKLAAEVSAAKKERDHYLAQVDNAKALTAMEQRRATKAQEGAKRGKNDSASYILASEGNKANQEATEATGGAGEVGISVGGNPRKLMKVYGQRATKPDPTSTDSAQMADDVLQMFAKRKKRKLEA